MVDVNVEFVLGQEEPIDADFLLEPDVTYTADIVTTVFSNKHPDLIGRDLPNQHPMGAITGLRDILKKLWTFTYEQASPSDTWVINHNLGRHPSVTVVDSSGNVFTPAVSYPTENQCIVEINGATTGKAYLN